MRKFLNFTKWSLATIVIFISIETLAQTDPDSVYYQRLYYLCKVWGHAKYFHTEIAKGKVNWDDKLIDAIGNIRKANSNEEYNSYILEMLESAGEMGIGSVTLPEIPDSLNNNSDISWINSPIFLNKVSANLDTIAQRFRPQNNVYAIESLPYMYHSFERDTMYYNNSAQDPIEELRLLALFRYWNKIHYFFPFKNTLEQSWDSTLMEFIPQIVMADNSLTYNLVLREFTTRTEDSHGFFYGPGFSRWNGSDYPPFLVRQIENEMVITKLRDEVTEISIGDIIKEIDGEDVDELKKKWRKYAHGSNEIAKKQHLNTILLSGKPGSFNIKLDDGESIKSIYLNRNMENWSILYQEEEQIAWKEITQNNGCKIGIIDIGKLEADSIDTMFKELWDTDAIIFDIRDYPKIHIELIADYLYPQPTLVIKNKIPDVTYPGRFYWKDHIVGGGKSDTYNGQIVILIDETIMSASEYLCLGLEKLPGAIKIGSSTKAALGNIGTLYLPGKIRTFVTFLGVHHADYKSTLRVGIVPDIEVLPTIEGIRNGKDEIMEVALAQVGCNMITSLDPTFNDPDYDFDLFPNPTMDFLRYEVEGVTLNQEIEFEIFDSRGRIIKRIKSQDNIGEINVYELHRGLYIIKIQLNELVISRIFVKI